MDLRQFIIKLKYLRNKILYYQISLLDFDDGVNLLFKAKERRTKKDNIKVKSMHKTFYCLFLRNKFEIMFTIVYLNLALCVLVNYRTSHLVIYTLINHVTNLLGKLYLDKIIVF